MIIGLFIRSFKTYQGLHFIPLSNEHNLCGLLGDNGIGKSSVLEAIDCFFNDRSWNLNNITKTKSTPYIVPVFAIDKTNIENQEVRDIFERIDSIFREIKDGDIYKGGGEKSFKDIFSQTHENAITKFHKESYYLIPIGIDDKRTPSFASLDSLFNKLITENDAKRALETVKSLFDYVYIPKDIDSEVFTRLEAKQMQVLMGESLEKVLNNRITEDSLRQINNKLNEFISTLDNDLAEYAYRTPTEKQQNIRKSYMNNLFIESFFNIRKLHKKQNEHFIEINNLSSGEKQKALIDVAYKLLKHRRKNGNNLIIAIDEPESSLHISACFEQFNKLFNISRDCRQVLFSSHWYGFLPILNKANVCIISKHENIHLFDLINLVNYREQILAQIKYSQGKLPYHIGLKSITDLAHSIITSIISERPYNWLICEGMSEKIYFEHYFSEEVNNKRLRIIPVGGANKIKDLYRNLITPYQEIKENIGNKSNPKWGKILLLSDTDSQFINYEPCEDDNFWCKRIVNDIEIGKTRLVSIDSNPKSPETEIEDCLNGKLFIETLKLFLDDYPELNNIIKEEKEYSEEASLFSLDLRPSEEKILKSFFDSNNGQNKVIYAERYTANMEHYKTPNWISEIKEWFK